MPSVSATTIILQIQSSVCFSLFRFKKEIMQTLFIVLGSSHVFLTFQKQCRISMFNASKPTSSIDLRFPIGFLLQRKYHWFMTFSYEKAQFGLCYILLHQLCFKLLCTFSIKFSSKGFNFDPSPLVFFTQITVSFSSFFLNLNMSLLFNLHCL